MAPKPWNRSTPKAVTDKQEYRGIVLNTKCTSPVAVPREKQRFLSSVLQPRRSPFEMTKREQESREQAICRYLPPHAVILDEAERNEGISVCWVATVD